MKLVEVSILMPYYDRAGQLWNTLTSYEQFYAGRLDMELVIVRDYKSINDAALDRCIARARTFMQVREVVDMDSRSTNPCRKYNIAASMANSVRAFVLTSPEVTHLNGFLVEAVDAVYVDPMRYIVAACRESKVNEEFYTPAKGIGMEGLRWEPGKWYQHGQHNNRRFHFCTVISREAWSRVGGFDEEYVHGLAYDDDDFLDRVLMAGLNVEVRDDYMTVHCFHPRKHQRMPDYAALVDRNRMLLERKRRGRKGVVSELANA